MAYRNQTDPSPQPWDAPTLTKSVEHGKAREFVTPAPLVPTRVEVLPPSEPYTIQVPTTAMVTSDTRGGYMDRAHAFRIRMMPVAAVAGGLGAVAAVSLFGVPLLSFALLLWYFTAFCITWLIGYGLDVLFSADGVALFQAVSIHRIVRAEQKERHKRYGVK